MQPGPLNVEMSKALAFLTRSQPDKAKPILLKLLKKRPKSADVLRNLARTCEQLGDIDESVRYIERAKKIDPNDPYVWSDAARLCKGAGRFTDGLAYAQKALKLAPTNKDNVALVAQALIWNGKYSEAIEMLESLMKQDSPPTGILNPWIDANFQLDNHEEVIRIATPIRDKTSSKMTYGMRREILSNLGLSLERLGRYEEAHEVFTEKNSGVTNRYSIEESANAIDQALAAWTPESFTSKRSTPLSESATPVFVLGFARSGTTLIERVIAAHPQASAAGECLFLSDAIKTRCPEDTPQMLYPTLAAELSDDDIEEMVNDAESHADEDKKRKEVVEARNQADGLVHSTESNLKEHSDKISEEDKLIIETTLQELKALLEGEDPDPDEIKTKSDALSEQAMKLGEAMYKASQAEAEAAGGESEEASSGEEAIDDADVVDAEFEEVNTDENQPNEDKKEDKKGN